MLTQPFVKSPKKYLKVPVELAGTPELTSQEKAVVLFLTTYSHMLPSREAIIRHTGISPNTLSRCLNRLRELGVINWESGNGFPNRYTVNSPTEWKLPGASA